MDGLGQARLEAALQSLGIELAPDEDQPALMRLAVQLDRRPGFALQHVVRLGVLAVVVGPGVGGDLDPVDAQRRLRALFASTTFNC